MILKKQGKRKGEMDILQAAHILQRDIYYNTNNPQNHKK